MTKVLIWMLLVLSSYTINCVAIESFDSIGDDTPPLISTAALRGAPSRVTVELLAVTALHLVDTQTKLRIRTLINNSVINLATLESRTLTIEATTSSIQNIGQLRFAVNDEPNFHTESLTPYTMCGNTDIRYFSCSILELVGKYTITAVPMSIDGLPGISQTVSFYVIDEPEEVPVKKTCSIPQLLGSTWSDFLPTYPFRVKETQGVMIGNDIIISSGFIDNYSDCTNETYARDVTGNKGNQWRRMDDLPVPSGITHGALTVVGTKLYICGGFSGGNPGLHVPDCYVYDHSKMPGGKQWSKISPLPNGGTGGGGLVYDTVTNSLYYAAGGTRDEMEPTREIYDINAFYKYDFDNRSAGWTDIGPCPYNANHISAVTAYDRLGNERHYFLGGQIGKDECRSNLNDVYEWNAVTMKWTQRANMPIPRGHAPSSTIPISCGFVIAGGSVNTPTGCFKQTSDISYYDIETDAWTSIGHLSNPVNVPVCSIGRDGYFYHISNVANRRRIVVQ